MKRCCELFALLFCVVSLQSLDFFYEYWEHDISEGGELRLNYYPINGGTGDGGCTIVLLTWGRFLWNDGCLQSVKLPWSWWSVYQGIPWISRLRLLSLLSLSSNPNLVKFVACWVHWEWLYTHFTWSINRTTASIASLLMPIDMRSWRIR